MRVTVRFATAIVNGTRGLCAASYWASAGTAATAEYDPGVVYVLVAVYAPVLSVVAVNVSVVVSGRVTVTVTVSPGAA